MEIHTLTIFANMLWITIWILEYFCSLCWREVWILRKLGDLCLGCDLPQRLGILAGRERKAMERPDPFHLT